ncbi:MAG TPA: hypothetical protein VGH76_26025 [Actinomycetospora sp.]|uniref:hypothetical protein n=1 Tax=Actinomycetospora sp. TaxID=1872135 RepID=UPI002F4098F8
MRTTVDLPPVVHRRAKEIAQQRGLSLSAVVAEFVVRGLIQLDEPAAIGVDARSGVSRDQHRSSSQLRRGGFASGRGVTTYLLDANVRIALTLSEHEQHTRASEWAAEIERFAVCPIVESADLGHVRGHRQVTDAYLVGLAASHHDSRLARMDGALARERPRLMTLVPAS